ncbi:ribosomal RNA-processing protein 8 [Aristolochia californica]|uniref:ribosomal RNA-processing protein 8 n=1 Tax=Aristolochia californica TaxID=171875 RepID=UPI0035E02B24
MVLSELTEELKMEGEMVDLGKRKRYAESNITPHASSGIRKKKTRRKAKFSDNRSAISSPIEKEKNPKQRKKDQSQDEGPSNSNLGYPLRKTKATSFLDKMRSRLRGGHFRMINEKLYTCNGNEALQFFKKDPTLFDVYHTGYQEQMSHWPQQPVNIIIKWIKNHSPSYVVADFGCGDARIAKSVKNKVFSIDLVSSDSSVIACDMSKTPLNTSSVDVAVFCLSLMGVNYPNYLQEARRVLNKCGWLLIAEVRSRFDPNNGGADPDKFSKAVQELGFTHVSQDFSNKMFVLFFFKKKEQQNKERKRIEWPELKACIYKRR